MVACFSQPRYKVSLCLGLVMWVSLFSFIGCSNNISQIETNYKTGLYTGHSETELFISVDSSSLPLGNYRKQDYYFDEGRVYLAGYNFKTHCIDVFSLTDFIFIKHIQLEKEGPNRILAVISMKVVSPDTILVADDLGFGLINSQGSVIQRIYRKDPLLFRNIPEGFLNTEEASFKPGFSKELNSIIVSYLPYDESNVFKEPFLLAINLKDLSTTLLNSSYPYYPKFDGFMPHYMGPQACYTENEIIINWSFSSDVYIYNLKTKEYSVKGGSSALTKNFLEPIPNGVDPTNFFLTSINFFKFVYDQHNELFYRAHWGEMPLKKEEFVFNTYYDKPVYLTVFDKDFNYLYETKLSIVNGIYPDNMVPTPEGLIVFPFKQELEDLDKDLVKCYLIKLIQ